MAEKKGVAETVFALAQPIVEGLGLKLWDVRFVKEGADSILRIIIDKEGGVCIDDCVAVNDALDVPLDEADPIPVPYRLQVQSPGVDRELTRPEHFEAFLGAPVKVKLHKAFQERKLWSGTLSAYEDGEVAVEVGEDAELRFARKEAVWVRLDDLQDFE